MASLTFAMGKEEDAEPYLLRIADGSKELVNTLTLVDYYQRTDRPQDAITRLDAVPNGRAIPAVALRIARAQAATGRRDEAKALVEEILKNNPKDADAHLLKSRLLLQDGAREEAFAAGTRRNIGRPFVGRGAVRAGLRLRATWRYCRCGGRISRSVANQSARRSRAGGTRPIADSDGKARRVPEYGG